MSLFKRIFESLAENIFCGKKRKRQGSLNFDNENEIFKIKKMAMEKDTREPYFSKKNIDNLKEKLASKCNIVKMRKITTKELIKISPVHNQELEVLDLKENLLEKNNFEYLNNKNDSPISFNKDYNIQSGKIEEIEMISYKNEEISKNEKFEIFEKIEKSEKSSEESFEKNELIQKEVKLESESERELEQEQKLQQELEQEQEYFQEYSEEQENELQEYNQEECENEYEKDIENEFKKLEYYISSKSLINESHNFPEIKFEDYKLLMK